MFGVTVLAAAACGGSGSKSPDAALPVLKLGKLIFAEDATGGSNTTTVGGSFGDQEESSSLRTDGPCVIKVALYGKSMLVSAGAITFTYGANQSMTLAPDANGHYANVVQQFLFATGDVISVSASGGTVPAFTSSITFPAGVTVTSPTTLSSVSKSGFTASWNATTSPVHIQIDQFVASMASTSSTSIDCSYAGAAGAGSVSPSAMMDLVPGAGVTGVAILTLVDTQSSSGDYSVDLGASVMGFSAPVVSVQP
jgi:hypothetical protein